MMQKLYGWRFLFGIIALIAVTFASYELGVRAAGQPATPPPAVVHDLSGPAVAAQPAGTGTVSPATGTPAPASQPAGSSGPVTPAPTAASAPETPTAGQPPTATTVPATETPAATSLPPTATPAPTATAAVAPAVQPVVILPVPGNSGAVLTTALNLRSGPALAYPILSALPDGARFVALAQDASGAWLFVALPDGKTGWLDRALTNYGATLPVIAAPPLAPTVASAPGTRPTIQIVSPTAGSTYVPGQQVTVQSVAAATGGVSQIQLLVDNSAVQTTTGGAGQTILQASQVWQATTFGSHTLTVVATDVFGNQSQPVSIGINVTANSSGLQVQIQHPRQPLVIQAGQEVTIQSEATSGAGVTRIELWVDDEFNTSTTSGNSGGESPFNVSQQWSSTDLGEHSLFVRAFDSTGRSADSDTITIGVADTNPPQVSVSISANTVTQGQPVTVSTHASDSKGITDIELFVDGQQVAVTNSDSSVGQSSMSTAQTWQAAGAGQHTLFVVAHDSQGKSTQSPNMTVTVLSANTPTPTFTPIPVPTSTPLPTQTPTPAPTTTPAPTSTPAPTQAPTDTPTPKPTSTPVPTHTPTNTPTPKPTKTPTPTRTPTVERAFLATPTPSSTPTPTQVSRGRRTPDRG